MMDRLSPSMTSTTSVTIYKAPQPGKSKTFLANGFNPEDFPYLPDQPGHNGLCYFAGPNDRSIAEEYCLSYQEGVIAVTMDVETYQLYFEPLEVRYDRRGHLGCERKELLIPHSLLNVLNAFPKSLQTCDGSTLLFSITEVKP
jgi:hypothetical protein